MIQQLLEEKVPEIGVFETRIPGVAVGRAIEPIFKSKGILPPSICLIGKGRKTISYGDNKLHYDENHFLLSSLKVPVVGSLTDVTEKNPYLGLSILIDPVVINDLLLEFDNFGTKSFLKKPEGFMTSAKITDELRESFTRLISIIGDEMDEKVLGPVYVREILYKILKSDVGSHLVNCVSNHSKAHQIAPVVHFLERNLQEDISIDDLVQEVGMSSSALHEHFKEATSLSPMQYLKTLRLNNAKELILTGSNVSQAAMNSGYNSTTQFSREFKRLFGHSPSELRKSG